MLSTISHNGSDALRNSPRMEDERKEMVYAVLQAQQLGRRSCKVNVEKFELLVPEHLTNAFKKDS